MSVLYALSYVPGACGDFLCGEIWDKGNHWAKHLTNPHKAALQFSNKYGKSINRYAFLNTLYTLGIEDKPKVSKSLGNQVYTLDNRYGYPPDTYLKSLSNDELNEIWSKIEQQAQNKNLLSSVHCSRYCYPWQSPRLKYIAIKPGPKTSDITDAMRVVKSNRVNLLDESGGDSFEKLPLNDPEVISFITDPNVPKDTIELLESRGYATRWETYEFFTYSHSFEPSQPKIPNSELWIKCKSLLGHLDRYVQSDLTIDLDKLYEHDIDELAKLFKYFDVDDFDEQVCWQYFDKNIEIYESISATGNWKEYLAGYINIRTR